MDEYARPLYVLEELDAKALALVRALYEPRDVGYDKAAEVAVLDYPELRGERGERVVGYARFCRGNARYKGGFTGVRKADDADIGQKLQLELQAPLLAFLSRLGELRRLIGRRLEMRVALAAPSAPAADILLPVLDEVGQHLASIKVLNHRADGQFYPEVVAVLAAAQASLSVAAPARLVLPLIAEVEQAGEPPLGNEDDIAALSAVSAARAALGHELFAAERDATAPAVAGLYVYPCLVYELHSKTAFTAI